MQVYAILAVILNECDHCGLVQPSLVVVLSERGRLFLHIWTTSRCWC